MCVALVGSVPKPKTPLGLIGSIDDIFLVHTMGLLNQDHVLPHPTHKQC